MAMRKRIWIPVLLIGAMLIPAMAIAKESIYYLHNDHLGTPQAMSDGSGTIVWKAEYEPFGRVAIDEDPDGDNLAVTCNLRFPGQYFDSETGLQYNYHRDYDPGTGRYVEADPIGIQQGGNHHYAYVQNNPLLRTDATGLANYFGVVNLKCAGDGAGAGVLYGQIRTECWHGKYEEGLLIAGFVGGTWGLLVVDSTIFELNVSDDLPPDQGDLRNANGSAEIWQRFSGAVGPGASYGGVTLGKMQGKGWTPQLGLDAGFLWMRGMSHVFMIQEKCCHQQ
jgi:RHS repeat-associated protein